MGEDKRYICIIPSVMYGEVEWSIWYDTLTLEITHGRGHDPSTWPRYNSHTPERWRNHGWIYWFHGAAMEAYAKVIEYQKTGKIPPPPPPTPWFKTTGSADKQYENAE